MAERATVQVKEAGMPRVAIPEGEEAGPHPWTRLALHEFEALQACNAEINGYQACGLLRLARDMPAYLEGLGEAPDSRLSAQDGEAPDEAFYAAISDWCALPVFSERERLASEFGERLSLDCRSLEHDEPLWTDPPTASGRSSGSHLLRRLVCRFRPRLRPRHEPRLPHSARPAGVMQRLQFANFRVAGKVNG